MYAPGQFSQQVKSNGFHFERGMIICQLCDTPGWNYFDVSFSHMTSYSAHQINDIDYELSHFGIDIDNDQYVSPTDKAHTWKNHVVNHIVAIQKTKADYIVFADNDCWIVDQPEGKSWVELGIQMLQSNRDIFIVSPNDGEPERTTLRMSQQMFLVKVDEFRNANFNQPGYTGNPKDYDTMPEYHAMLEGRMEYHCRQSGQYRYVCPPQYRYWHFNRLNKEGYFETDRSKY